MTDVIDISKIRVGDYITARLRVSRVDTKYDDIMPVYAGGFWIRRDSIIGHQPRPITVGDTVKDAFGRTCVVKSIYEDDGIATIKYGDGSYFILSLRALVLVKEANQ